MPAPALTSVPATVAAPSVKTRLVPPPPSSLEYPPALMPDQPVLVATFPQSQHQQRSTAEGPWPQPPPHHSLLERIIPTRFVARLSHQPQSTGDSNDPRQSCAVRGCTQLTLGGRVTMPSVLGDLHAAGHSEVTSGSPVCEAHIVDALRQADRRVFAHTAASSSSACQTIALNQAGNAPTTITPPREPSNTQGRITGFGSAPLTAAGGSYYTGVQQQVDYQTDRVTHTAGSSSSSSQLTFHHPAALDPTSFSTSTSTSHERDALMEAGSSAHHHHASPTLSCSPLPTGPIYASHHSSSSSSSSLRVVELAREAAALCWLVVIKAAHIVQRTANTIVMRDY